MHPSLHRTPRSLTTEKRSPQDPAAPPRTPPPARHPAHQHTHSHSLEQPPQGRRLYPPEPLAQLVGRVPRSAAAPGQGQERQRAEALPRAGPQGAWAPLRRPAPRGGAECDGRGEGGRWRSGGGGGGQEAEAERAGRGPRGPVRQSGERAAAGAGRPRAKGAAAGPGAARGGQRPPGAVLALCSRSGSGAGRASSLSPAGVWPRQPPRAPRPRRAPDSGTAGEDGAWISPKLRRWGTSSKEKPLQEPGRDSAIASIRRTSGP